MLHVIHRQYLQNGYLVAEVEMDNGKIFPDPNINITFVPDAEHHEGLPCYAQDGTYMLAHKVSIRLHPSDIPKLVELLSVEMPEPEEAK